MAQPSPGFQRELVASFAIDPGSLPTGLYPPSASRPWPTVVFTDEYGLTFDVTSGTLTLAGDVDWGGGAGDSYPYIQVAFYMAVDETAITSLLDYFDSLLSPTTYNYRVVGLVETFPDFGGTYAAPAVGTISTTGDLTSSSSPVVVSASSPGSAGSGTFEITWNLTTAIAAAGFTPNNYLVTAQWTDVYSSGTDYLYLAAVWDGDPGAPWISHKFLDP